MLTDLVNYAITKREELTRTDCSEQRSSNAQNHQILLHCGIWGETDIDVIEKTLKSSEEVFIVKSTREKASVSHTNISEYVGNNILHEYTSELVEVITALSKEGRLNDYILYFCIKRENGSFYFIIKTRQKKSSIYNFFKKHDIEIDYLTVTIQH